jgi:hypothetical protein
LLGGDLQDPLQQRHGPAYVRVAQVLGGASEEGLQQVLLVFVQQRGASSALFVLQCRGVVILGIDLDPVIDTLPGYAQHPGDVGGGTAVVVLENGQGAPKEAGIPGLRELTAETVPLPGGQVEPAHALLLCG